MANRGGDSSDDQERSKKKKKNEGKRVWKSSAACKHGEKICTEGECEFAQHFSAYRMEDLIAVQRVFENVTRKMLKETDPIQGGEMAKTLIWEANCWENDPVQGPLGYHSRLVRHLDNQIRSKDQEIQQLREVIIMQQQRQPVLLPWLPSDGDDNYGRMGGHHRQDHHRHFENQISDEDQEIQLLTNKFKLLQQQPIIFEDSNVGLMPHHPHHHLLPDDLLTSMLFQESATFQGGYMPPSTPSPHHHHLQEDHRAPMLFQEKATFEGGYAAASSSTFPSMPPPPPPPPHHLQEDHRAPMLFQEKATFEGGYAAASSSTFPSMPPSPPPPPPHHHHLLEDHRAPMLFQEKATFEGGYAAASSSTFPSMPPSPPPPPPHHHHLLEDHRAPMLFQEKVTFEGGYAVASSSTFPHATAYNQNPVVVQDLSHPHQEDEGNIGRNIGVEGLGYDNFLQGSDGSAGAAATFDINEDDRGGISLDGDSNVNENPSRFESGQRSGKQSWRDLFP